MAFYQRAPADPDVAVRYYLRRSCFMEVLAILQRLFIIAFPGSTWYNRNPSHCGQLGGRRRNAMHSSSAVMTAGLCAVPRALQFSAALTRCARRDYSATCATPPPRDSSKMLLACWDKEINENAAVNLSRTEGAGLKPRAIHEASVNLPSDLWHKRVCMQRCATTCFVFAKCQYRHGGGDAVSLLALHVRDSNSILFISRICHTLDWMWNRCWWHFFWVFYLVFL